MQYLSFGVIILLLLLLLSNNLITNNELDSNKINNNEINNDEVNTATELNNVNTVDSFRNSNDNIIVESDFRKIDALDKIYNPLEYPYQSHPFYSSRWYPSNMLPPNVLECGHRRQPCYGGSQKVISNKYPVKHVSDYNIAPVNIRTRGPEGEPQQVGTLFNLLPGNTEVHPLFGRKKFPNDSKWEYYTIIGRHSAKVPVKPLRNYEEIGSSDIVNLVNYPGNFKATVFKREDLQYIPYV